jgi:hypothetical protein
MRIRRHFLRKLWLLSVLTACFAWGQATNSAEVTGSVTDPSKAIVPGVTASVRYLDKDTERTFIYGNARSFDPNVINPATNAPGGMWYAITHGNHGPSNFDIRPMVKGHAAYDLPFGRGRKFVNTSKPLDAVIGGWTLFADFVAQGGSPFTPSMRVNNSYSQSSNALWYPNVAGDPTAVAGGQTINSWFNVNAFAAPTPGTFWNMGRNIVYGPRLTSINASLHETYKLTGRLNLDISPNAANLINHPSFALPDKVIARVTSEGSRPPVWAPVKWNWSQS